MANHAEHCFMVNGDKEIHLHSEGGKPFGLSVSDEGALQIKNETTGESAGVGGGIATAIIKHGNFDNILAGVATVAAPASETYTCENMTFDEAMSLMAAGTPVSAMLKMTWNDVPNYAPAMSMAICYSDSGAPYIEVAIGVEQYIYWTMHNEFQTTTPA